ncbi:MAG: exodeoxyribonuclease VII large subunit [Kiritimatiellae bacterium]|nr:exodeoxyribonuclease VII large subunit [Kiritimatiellia bacterium]
MSPKIYRVSEITSHIKSVLDRDIGEVWVEGEISNARQSHAGGHWYFTLKDETAQLPAVLFRGEAANLRICPRDGLLVRVLGRVTIYEKGGNYEIIVRLMEESGWGVLMARFHALKEKLRAEGLFDTARKKKLPLLPQHIGVVTSPSGAAIRDILKVLLQRFPNVHVLIAPVRVQGDGAAEEIAAAIDCLNRLGGLDVLIVGRGGGSLEELWPFNEEVVARAIFRSRIPVISAVGHEIDFTISDFVADVRAPTPSAAAEMVVKSKLDFEKHLGDLARHLVQAVIQQVRNARHRLDLAASSYVFREPQNILQFRLQELDVLEARVTECLQTVIRRQTEHLQQLVLRMKHQIQLRHKLCWERLNRLSGQLGILDPVAVLSRGYSITSDECGRVISSVASVTEGQRVSTRVKDGIFLSTVVAKADRLSETREEK